MEKFSGLGMNLGSLSRLSAAETHSISPENLTGQPGKGERYACRIRVGDCRAAEAFELVCDP
jgi:hypothetical protein